MIGAIVGDIAGSPYEFDNIKTTAFPFFRISLDDDPVVDGDTGDITGDEIALLKDFVRRNRDLIHAHWIGKKDSSVVTQLKFD